MPPSPIAVTGRGVGICLGFVGGEQEGDGLDSCFIFAVSDDDSFGMGVPFRPVSARLGFTNSGG